MTTTYTFEAKTDEVTTCECCGKQNLKGTVVLKDQEGEFKFFGTTCAARALGKKNASTAKAARFIQELADNRQLHTAHIEQAKDMMRRGYSPRVFLIGNKQNSVSDGMLTITSYGFTTVIDFTTIWLHYRQAS